MRDRDNNSAQIFYTRERNVEEGGESIAQGDQERNCVTILSSEGEELLVCNCQVPVNG